jgi:hypothetical protein
MTRKLEAEKPMLIECPDDVSFGLDNQWETN